MEHFVDGSWRIMVLLIVSGFKYRCQSCNIKEGAMVGDGLGKLNTVATVGLLKNNQKQFMAMLHNRKISSINLSQV
jgi:hypothetical protein